MLDQQCGMGPSLESWGKHGPFAHGDNRKRSFLSQKHKETILFFAGILAVRWNRTLAWA